jgi:hypothetical protein
MKTDKQIFTDEKAPLIALLWAVTKNYESRAFDWIPSILRSEIETDINKEISDLQADKIQAAIAMASTNMYETDLRTFEVCSRLASCTPQDFEDFEPLEAEELVIGLVNAYLIKGEKLDFSDEVELYAGKVFYDYGFHNPPELFPTAILPEDRNSEGSDNEKNEALKEIFDSCVKEIQSYMTSIIK